MGDIGGPRDDGGIAPGRDPFHLFTEWLKEAEAGEPNDPNAMSLATVDAEGRPNVRMVLLKGVDQTGFVFYTNKESAKGQELAANAAAAANFHWKSLRRAVRIRGTVSEVTPAEADAYFATRAKDSQIGAWASAQSRLMEGRWAFPSRRPWTAIQCSSIARPYRKRLKGSRPCIQRCTQNLIGCWRSAAGAAERQRSLSGPFPPVPQLIDAHPSAPAETS